MKRVFSILFAALILVSGIHLSVATHFCGGVTFERISLTGELASCGMEDSSDQRNPSEVQIKSHCCDNEVLILSVDNNYSPSFSEFKIFLQPVSQGCIIPVGYHFQSILVFNHFNTNVFPPGNYLASSVSLPDICVFRI